MIVLRPLWRVVLALRLVALFLAELVAANAMVAWEVMTPRQSIRPGIIRVPLRARSDVEITLLANLISLIPGTLSLEVSDDRTALFVHGLHVDSPEQLRKRVGRLESRILEVLR